MKLYVASSWRNPIFETVLEQLGKAKIKYHNFKAKGGFHWSEIDVNWGTWSPSSVIQALSHFKCEEAFKIDFDAMKACDACLLVYPCGKSAHLEAGWFVGQGKRLYVLFDGEPELMLKMATFIAYDIQSIINRIREDIK